MRILNIGSLNLDYVYRVDHIILPGETEATHSREVFLGGKGINQSIALAKAGASVFHGGLIGPGGQPFLEACREYGVDFRYIRSIDAPDGHTEIQIDREGQNSILLFGGTNRMLTREFVDSILADFGAEDMLLLQNEVNLLPYIIDRAYERGMTVVLNPSPFNSLVQEADLSKVSLFLLNEIEGHQLTGFRSPEQILQTLRQRYPQARIVLTLGKDGAYYADAAQTVFQPIFPVKAVDTTAAGDTFTGFFLASLTEGIPVAQALHISAKASSICVTRPGAVASIPTKEEVLAALENE